MPSTETAEPASTRDAAVPERAHPSPPTPEAAVPETRSADAGLPLWIFSVALGALITVAWVGALVAVAWWLIRTVLL